MNDSILLNDFETRAVDLILEDDFEDPINLVERIGYDKGTFFQFGDFDFIDLTGSDIADVSFQGARFRHVVLRPDQVTPFLATGPIVKCDLDVRRTRVAKGNSDPQPSFERIDARPASTLGPQELVQLVRTYNPNCNDALLTGAYAYAQEMHEGQARHSGEPYFTHPVAVAAILTEQRLDDATIATALLHDTIEDTKGTYAEIERRFGADIRGFG